MTNYIDANKLKAEIEKRLKNTRDYMTGAGVKYKGPKYHKAQGKESAYDALLNVIDSLQQQEQPDAEDLKREWWNKGYYEGRKNAHIPAKELGLPKAWDFQQEQPSEDLEKAATISLDEAKSLSDEYVYYLAKGIKENQPRPVGPKWFIEYAKKRFIAGANWQKEQMPKDAVEATVMATKCGDKHQQLLITDWNGSNSLHNGDNVKVVIIPQKEDKE